MQKKIRYIYFLIFFTILLTTCIGYVQHLNMSQKMENQMAEKAFKTAIEMKYPVVLVFYASWCQDSLGFIPIVRAQENKFGEKVLFIKVNVDDEANNAFAGKYNFKYLPHTVVYDRMGVVFVEFTGIKTHNQMEEIIIKLL